MGIDLNKDKDLLNVSVQEANDNGDGKIEEQSIFSRAFSFSGRIRRSEFAISYIVYFVVSVILSFIKDEIIFAAFLIILLWFLLAQMCKRFHDRGESGLLMLTLLIPLYNIYVLIMLFFGDGEPHENTYGKDPKGRDMYI